MFVMFEMCVYVCVSVCARVRSTTKCTALMVQKFDRYDRYIYLFKPIYPKMSTSKLNFYFCIYLLIPILTSTHNRQLE